MLFLLLVNVLRNSYPTISITMYVICNCSALLRCALLVVFITSIQLSEVTLHLFSSCLLVSHPFAVNFLAVVLTSFLPFSSNSENINIFQFEKQWNHVKWQYLYSLFSWCLMKHFFFFQLRGSSTFIVKEINQSFVTPMVNKLKRHPSATCLLSSFVFL